MIVEEREFGGRCVRVFAREPNAIDPVSAADQLRRESEEEATRLAAIRVLVTNGRVLHALVYPTVDALDVLQVFLASAPGADDMVFASVLVPPRRAREWVDARGQLVEGLDLAVAGSDRISEASVRDAIEAWAGRAVPGITLPALEVTAWAREGEPSAGVLALLLTKPPLRRIGSLEERDAHPSHDLEAA